MVNPNLVILICSIIPESYFHGLSDIASQTEDDGYTEYVNQWLRKIQAQSFSDNSDMKWVRTRSVAQTLAVQGPFASSATEACKIVAVPTFPAVLLVLGARGTVNILVQTSPSYPRWMNQFEIEVSIIIIIVIVIVIVS